MNMLLKPKKFFKYKLKFMTKYSIYRHVRYMDNITDQHNSASSTKNGCWFPLSEIFNGFVYRAIEIRS